MLIKNWLNKQRNRLIFNKNKQVTVVEKSNIIQLDDMGYPLLLCIMSDGDQRWIDVSCEWAEREYDNGNLHILEWSK